MFSLESRHGAAPRPRTSLVIAIAGTLLPACAGAAPLRQGALELRAEIKALASARPRLPQGPAATVPVTSCADDDSPGTLRAAVAAAGDGYTVDLSALACSTITLAQGAIPVLFDTLTIVGPAGHDLAVDAASASRVFVHPGAGALTLSRIGVRNGALRVSGNHVSGGGCIASAGYVVLDHSSVSGCYAAAEGVYGGAIFAYALRMYTSTLSGSTGRGYDPGVGTAVFGGGAYAATATLVDSTVSGNRADFDGRSLSHYDIGGGLFTNSGGTIERSTIAANYSAGLGGGIAAFGGHLDLLDSTLSGNVAAGGSGGALDVRVFYGLSIASSTIAGNSAATGGGVYLRGRPADVSLDSTIISGNSATAGAADIGASSATTLAGANNLVFAAAAEVTLPPGTLHADPLLLPLAANGGPTLTRALAPGSPALDAGNNAAALATDQRGLPRVAGVAADIGAFEGFVAPQAPSVPAPLASGGVLGLLAAALAAAGAWASRRRAAFTHLSPRREHPSHR